jgi:phosphohistidine phosphatase SixA
VPLYLIRHAKAGSRQGWPGPDERRPLSRAGWAQAEAIADRLEGAGVKRLFSSPYVRCRQTLEPLADRLSIAIELHAELAEGNRFESLLPLLDELPDDTVLCSHGDVIPSIIDALIRRGMAVEGRADTRKASMWVVERDEKGSWISGRAEAPPDAEPLV